MDIGFGGLIFKIKSKEVTNEIYSFFVMLIRVDYRSID